MLRFGRFAIALGIAMILLGAGALLAHRMGIQKLPGDIVIRKPRWTVYFPLGSSLFLSLVLTLVLNFLIRRR